MKMDSITRNLLEKIASLHEIPEGAVSFRYNGAGEIIRSTINIEIERKEDKSGINIFVHSSCQGEACHIPVVVNEDDFYDKVYNDFYIEDDADVVINAGCGVHSDSGSGHDGIHTFHLGKNSKVKYYENHYATGYGENKVLNPTTIINQEEGSFLEMETNQIGGVDLSNRKTVAKLKDNATLIIKEKIMTDNYNTTKTDFKVSLLGDNSKCDIISRSVAKGNSKQIFKSNMIGKNNCFGHVECDGILFDNAIIVGQPIVSAEHHLATLTHEAAIGKIAGEQITKLMTLGLNEEQAEEKIIAGFLK